MTCANCGLPIRRDPPVPAKEAAQDALLAGAHLRPVSGHHLARELITKHGVDRYPTAQSQLGKVTEEVGELWGALLKAKGDAAVRKEYGDVGLALYALGDKLGLDLDECMRQVYDGETRVFAEAEDTRDTPEWTPLGFMNP